jgi:hypothetical protein
VTTPTPTGEQQAIIDAYQTNANLVIEAGAGTGRTSTLRMLAACNPRRCGLYVAYNKAIASDAKRSFPSSVTWATIHCSRRFSRLSGQPGSTQIRSPRVVREGSTLLVRSSAIDGVGVLLCGAFHHSGEISLAWARVLSCVP